MFPFPPAWTHEMGLPSEARIQELWDTIVPIISGTFTDSICSFLPYNGLREPLSITRHCIDPYHFVIRPDGPGHGSRFETRGHKPRLQGPKGVSTPTHLKMRLLISQLFWVHLCSFNYRQEYYLFLVHHILLLLHHVWKLWA